MLKICQKYFNKYRQVQFFPGKQIYRVFNLCFLKAYSEPLLHNVFRLVDHLCQAEHLDTSQLRYSFHTCGN